MSEEVKKITPCDGTPESCHGNSEECDKDPAHCLANSSFKDSVKADAADGMDDCLGKSLDQLSKAFMASAKRWEMVVYPSLGAFMILAAYGFYLIYSLTDDAAHIAESMTQMTSNMTEMTNNMNQIVVHMDAMSRNMVLMTQTVDSQSASMQEMTQHMRGMNHSMNQMRYDFSVLNNSVSRPMSFMNTFMPW